ncbi:precorrin-6A reductase [Enemella dayhoffiae]|uniref:Precorrin-6A reductase n=1 Tax=Enemella dayhoffiae TaxID=2016507 RepID=A0A255H8Q6_9ACTN|nr:cobalt-precorrin-6A reductase [Enemella dayhoffiae]OYO24110.1 precorrin-6A reductase [Enemella dayhoffiae]
MARVLVLGGTGEARELAVRLQDAGVSVVSSLAGRVSNPALPVGPVRIGGFGGPDGMMSFLWDERFDAVCDATHPFAARISGNAVEACAAAGVPLVRLVRPGWETRPDARDWVWVDSMAEAPAAMELLGERPFLTSGRQGLDHFAGWRNRWALVRVVEPLEAGVWPAWTVLVGRGPFTLDGELALMREHDVEVLVTKNSGGSLTEAKLAAAARLGVAVVMVRRPAESAEVLVGSVDEALALLPGAR